MVVAAVVVAEISRGALATVVVVMGMSRISVTMSLLITLSLPLHLRVVSRE